MTTENYDGYIDWISSDKTKAKYVANFVPPTEPYVVSISCQSCGHAPLKEVIDLGYMPAVNAMHKIGEPVAEEPFFPTIMSVCEKCELVQLGGPPPDNNKVFPPDYPYTTTSSKPLIENFYRLVQEVSKLKPGKLSVCDIGSNDGTLLQAFKNLGHEVLGIEPTDIADMAAANGIPTWKAFFQESVADDVLLRYGKFDVVTCANCFAHMPNVNDIIKAIKTILKTDGIFVSESHYLFDLLRDVQYDTIYHEHLRFYSVRSLQALFHRHGLFINSVKKIPTHGGSIRVYASANHTLNSDLPDEPTGNELDKCLREFEQRVLWSRWDFWDKLTDHVAVSKTDMIVGVGAPSRGAILINYLGLSHNDLTYVAEREGSLKIGRHIPGTRIPVVTESKLDMSEIDYALILSWHMADAIMQNWRGKGYKGKFIIPLPQPRII